MANDRERVSGSHGRIRTCIDRLTAERPPVGRHGKKRASKGRHWKIGGAMGNRTPRRRSCKDHPSPTTSPWNGAHGRTRTSICNSVYGSPVRSRRRLRARGAWGWFRANLSAFSARRCHQISFPGMPRRAREHVPKPAMRRIGADAGNRTRTSRVALSCSAVELRPHGGEWVELNALPQRDGVYSAATGPPVLICIPRDLGCPSWLQVAESNRAQNGL